MQLQLRRYGGLAAFVCGMIWGLGPLCFVLLFTPEAPQALRDAAQGAETFALFSFLSDFLPILAFPAHGVLILVLHSLERNYEPRPGLPIALVGTAYAMIGTANGILTVSLAFAAGYPDRLRSLPLIESGWIGNRGWTPEEASQWAEMDRIMTLPDPERMVGFSRNQLRPGVAFISPPGPPTAMDGAAARGIGCPQSSPQGL